MASNLSFESCTIRSTSGKTALRQYCLGVSAGTLTRCSWATAIRGILGSIHIRLPFPLRAHKDPPKPSGQKKVKRKTS